jgi:hypothetical protein
MLQQQCEASYAPANDGGIGDAAAVGVVCSCGGWIRCKNTAHLSTCSATAALTVLGDPPSACSACCVAIVDENDGMISTNHAEISFKRALGPRHLELQMLEDSAVLTCRDMVGTGSLPLRVSFALGSLCP